MNYKEFTKKVEKFNEFSKLWNLDYEVTCIHGNDENQFYNVNLYFVSFDDKFIPQAILSDFVSDANCYGVEYSSNKLTLKFDLDA